METRVLVLRVLRDDSTTVVVRVLESNAVLKCEVTNDSTHDSKRKIRPGELATIHVHTLDFPIIRASIITDDIPGVQLLSECHALTGTEALARHITTPPRKRMYFQ
jgi:hypothetical protein